MKNEAIKRIISSIIIIPLSLFFIVKGSIFFIFFITVCFLIASYEWYIMTKNKQYNVPGHLFLIISFYSAYLYREHLSPDAELFLFIILICVSTDIGGYIFGKLFKGPKLTKISPNKTYAGMFGGYFLSIISVNIFIDYGSSIRDFIKPDLIWDPFFSFKFFVLVIAISTISQIGDLTVSYFKRLSKTKNTGKIIPGHGGILDRVDGMIFALPASYILSKFLI